MTLFKVFLQLLVDFYFFVLSPKLSQRGAQTPVKIVAHRGWHNNNNLIENTFQSFQTAIDNNLFGIEFDVRWTKDNIAVVHHDRDLKRLWGENGVIADYTYEELQKLVPMIPKLDDVIKRFGKKIHLFIELKEDHFHSNEIQKKHLSNVLNPLIELRDFHLMSLSMNIVNLFDNFPPKLFIFISEFQVGEMLSIVHKNKLGGISCHYTLLSNDQVKACLRKQLVIGTGFVRTRGVLNRERNRQVTYHFSNHPWNLI